MESTTRAKMSLLLEQQSFLRKELEWAKTHEFRDANNKKDSCGNTLYGNLSEKGVEYEQEVAQALRNHNKEVDRIYSGVANGKILLVRNGIVL